MDTDHINSSLVKMGRSICLMVFALGILYAIITAIGLYTLPSPQDTIADPYFTLMEILSILIALLMALSMVAVHYYAPSSKKQFSLAALIFMCMAAVITSGVHFLVLSLGHTATAKQLPEYNFIFSFTWPSVVYALDILAWDLFYALSVLFAASIFNEDKYSNQVKLLLVISGVLSLAGLIGVPLGNMQVRNIGIIGYAVTGPVAFLFIGKTFGRSAKVKVP